MERQRFMQLYGLDCDYWRNYDLVIDTSYALPEEAAEVLLRKLQSGEPPAGRYPMRQNRFRVPRAVMHRRVSEPPLRPPTVTVVTRRPVRLFGAAISVRRSARLSGGK